MKEYPKAIADYTKAINMYCELKDHLETIDDNIKATELVDPCLIVVYLARGMAYIKQQRYLEAIADYTNAIELVPMFVAAYTARGFAYGQLKKHSEVVADCTKAIYLAPKLPTVYKLRAAAYKALGKTKEANADFAKAKELEK